MWIAVIVIVVITIWVMIGGFWHTSSPPTPAPQDNCASCRTLDAWWNSLDFWGKLAGAPWYGIQKIGCAIKGCNK